MSDGLTITRFRALILCYVASLMAAAVVDVQYFPAQISDELAAAYTKEAILPLVASPTVFLLLSVIALVAIIVPAVPRPFANVRSWNCLVASFSNAMGRDIGTGIFLARKL